MVLTNNASVYLWNCSSDLKIAGRVIEMHTASDGYTIGIYGVEAQNASSVRFGTWTNKNGQDDLKWTQGTKVTNGAKSIRWQSKIYKSAHNNETGNYITHIYMTVNGTESYIHGINFNLT